jgi:hypothetical protein
VTQQLARDAHKTLGHEAAELASKTAAQSATELTESIARRSGIRLAKIQSEPAGRYVLGYLAGVPYRRMTKYVVANGGQAAVGVAAIQKMEEYVKAKQNK